MNNNRIYFYLNSQKRGFGNSIVMGLSKSKSDIVTIMMADSSDSLTDLSEYYKLMKGDKNLDLQGH